MASVDRRLTALLAYQYTGMITKREDWGFGGYPHGRFPLPGWVLRHYRSSGGYFSRTVKMMGSPEALQDPKWYHSLDGAVGPRRSTKNLRMIFYPWILSRTKQELWEAAQQAQVLGALH